MDRAQALRHRAAVRTQVGRRHRWRSRCRCLCHRSVAGLVLYSAFKVSGFEESCVDEGDCLVGRGSSHPARSSDRVDANSHRGAAACGRSRPHSWLEPAGGPMAARATPLVAPARCRHDLGGGSRAAHPRIGASEKPPAPRGRRIAGAPSGLQARPASRSLTRDRDQSCAARPRKRTWLSPTMRRSRSSKPDGISTSIFASSSRRTRASGFSQPPASAEASAFSPRPLR